MPFMPSAALLSNQGGYFPVGTPARYVAASGGSNGNDGLSPKTAMATIQFAYDSLPSSGGTMLLLQGTHSVGSGFVGSHIKPCVFVGQTGWEPTQGYFPFYNQQGSLSSVMPVITGTGATLIKINDDTANIARGWGFYGLGFDMRDASNTTGIWCNGVNFVRVKDCTAEGDGGAGDYFIRSNYTAATDNDASWYRIEDNACRQVGLCSLGDGETVGNVNNCQITNNVVFGAGGFNIKMAAAQRCVVSGNNLEGDGPGGVLWTAISRYNATVWNAGEGTISPYVQYDDLSYGNVHSNWGSLAGAVLVNDLSGSGSFATGSYSYAQTLVGSSEKTADYTLVAGNWFGTLLDMNKATAITVTVPKQATLGIVIGSSLLVRQKGAGTVTIAPEAGVTINSLAGLRTSGQYGVITLQKIGIDVWAAWGDTMV